MNIAEWVTDALEQSLNRYLAFDPDSARRLAVLRNRVIAIELAGLEQTLYITEVDGRLQIDRQCGREPDTRLRGTPIALARLGLPGTARGVFVGRVDIEGDAELGQAFRELLDHIEVDWEEQISQWVGDVAAHQIARAARAARAWAGEAAQSLEQDLAEYLQEESHDLPRREEVRRFIGAVDALRDDVERLAARIERLQERTGER